MCFVGDANERETVCARGEKRAGEIFSREKLCLERRGNIYRWDVERESGEITDNGNDNTVVYQIFWFIEESGNVAGAFS